MGAMTPPSRKSCYNFRVVSIDKVVDGDTIDVTCLLYTSPSPRDRQKSRMTSSA